MQTDEIEQKILSILQFITDLAKLEYTLDEIKSMVLYKAERMLGIGEAMLFANSLNDVKSDAYLAYNAGRTLRDADEKIGLLHEGENGAPEAVKMRLVKKTWDAVEKKRLETDW